MRFTEQAQEVAQSIVEAFRAGEVPKALADLYIRRHIDSACRAWSLTNRLIIALAGHFDARGFRQWKDVGRRVKKGARASYILAPMRVKAREDDPDRGIEKGDPMVIGFRTIPVFGYLQTEGEPLAGMEDEVSLVDSLPLIEVARSWGLTVETYDVGRLRARGLYQPDTGIALGVRNLSTWAHELVHAADHRLGSSAATSPKTALLEREVVAELGGAVLLECLGESTASDRGGAFAYIEHFAKEHGTSTISVCTDLLARTCAAVDLILSTADELASAASPAPPTEASPLPSAAVAVSA